MEKEQSFQQMVPEQQDIHMQKDEVEPHFLHLHKNELKMDHRLTITAESIKFCKKA